MNTDKLPAGWTRVKFGDIAASITERVDDPSAAGVDRYVGLEHLDPESTSIRRWGSPSDVESTKLRFYPGDVIYGRRRAYQRKLGVADFDGICSAHALVLRAKPEVCLPEFLPYFLQSDAFHQRALDISVGSLSPTINWKTLAVQEFALPPIDEQQRIVEFQKAHLAVAEGLKRVEGTAEGFFDSVLRSAFSETERRVEWRTLADVAEIQLGRMLSAERSTGPDLAPYIKNTNIQWGGLDLENLPMMSFPMSERSRYSLRAGDVLVCEGGDAGRSVLLEENLEGIYYQKAVHRVRTTCLNPRYLHFYLVFAYRTGELRKLSTGTAIPHLPAERFRRLAVPIVSDEIQAAVTASLIRARRVAAAARESRENVVAQSRAVLHAALEGFEDV